MSATDKIKNAAAGAKGKVKQSAGKVTDNDRVQAQGRSEQAGADAKKAGENVKDAFKH